GQSLLVPDAYADPRFFRDADRQTGFRTRSILCVPLERDGKEIGVLQVLNPLHRDSFDADDLTAFEAYGTMAATAIYKLRAIERQRERERIEQEFTFARDIQKSFMPETLPERDGIQFATAYRPARFVGGDFYDVIEVRKGQFFFVIGDVSGKGMPAALLMAQALSTLRLILHSRMSPARALNRWNDLLCQQTIRGMFITALLGRVDTAQRQIELASAGHCHPICARLDAPPHEIPVPGGPPLGIAPGRMYRSVTAALGVGDWLINYTDGLSESFNDAREPLHPAGVGELLRGPFADAAAVVRALELGERVHRGEADPHDDLTMLVFGFR
ncbi:MAG: GAF domain-containing SpoIIE family protein phosphatase, partial [Chthoniobacteraceae bacterium]